MPTPEGMRGGADPPSEVEITVLRDPAARRAAQRVADMTRRPSTHPIVALGPAITVIAVIAAIAAGGLLGEPRGRAQQSAADQQGAAGVAAASGYPLPCLSVTIAATDHSYARADFNRSSACGRYDGSATAIFHRSGGIWRAVLNASSYRCPLPDVPREVQTELAVCP